MSNIPKFNDTPPIVPDRSTGDPTFSQRMATWWTWLASFFTYLGTLVDALNSWVDAVPIAQVEENSTAPDRVWPASKSNAMAKIRNIEYITIPSASVSADTIITVKSFPYIIRESGSKLHILFSPQIESKGGSDVGLGVYVEVDGSRVDASNHYTIDRWGGDVSNGNIRMFYVINADCPHEKNKGETVNIEVKLEAAGSDALLSERKIRIEEYK